MSFAIFVELFVVGGGLFKIFKVVSLERLGYIMCGSILDSAGCEKFKKVYKREYLCKSELTLFMVRSGLGLVIFSGHICFLFLTAVSATVGAVYLGQALDSG